MTAESTPVRRRSSRITAIDGLRGVAALMVLFHHLSLTNSWYSDRIGAPNNVSVAFFPTRPWQSVQTLFEWSPLHMVYASNAVFIFFVVSGFILVPTVRRFGAHAYGAGRIIRLYVPIFAAAVPAVLFALAYGSHAKTEASTFLNSHVAHVNLRSVTGILWLVDGGTDLNSSLWTMRYEVIFSLVLPAILWSVASTSTSTRVRLLSLAGLLVATSLGVETGFTLLTYIPVFFCGVLLAYLPAPKGGGLGLIVAGVLAMNLVWEFGGFHVRIGPGLSTH